LTKEADLTRTISWRRLAYAICAVATLAALLYTIGAPWDQGG
jgi:hypothetical protein